MQTVNTYLVYVGLQAVDGHVPQVVEEIADMVGSSVTSYNVDQQSPSLATNVPSLLDCITATPGSQQRVDIYLFKSGEGVGVTVGVVVTVTVGVTDGLTHKHSGWSHMLSIRLPYETGIPVVPKLTFVIV